MLGLLPPGCGNSTEKVTEAQVYPLLITFHVTNAVLDSGDTKIVRHIPVPRSHRCLITRSLQSWHLRSCIMEKHFVNCKALDQDDLVV